MRRAAALFVLLLGLGALAPGPAAAHAALLETVPADGAVLAEAPREIVLRFDEPVTPIVVRVLRGDGTAVAAEARARDDVVRVVLPAALPAGGYVVSYRVTSADSHPVGGAFVFAVGAGAAAPPRPADADAAAEAGWNGAVIVDRALHLGALALAAGGALFLLLVIGRAGSAASSAIRRGLRWPAGIAILTALLDIGLEGGLLSAGSLGDLARPATWALGLASTAGTSALVAAAALLILLLGLALPPGRRSAGALALGAAGALGALALTGHAASAAPRALTVPAVLLHSAAMAFWLGAFWPLRVVLARETRPAAAALVARFSRRAVAAVALLVLAGLALAVVQVETPAALVATDYGRLLLAKLAAVAALIGLAAWNRLRLSPRLAAGDGGAARALAGSITAEMAVAAMILVLTAALGQTPPPRALGAIHRHAAAGYAVVASAPELTATLTLVPARAGRNVLDVYLQRGDGAALAARELEVELALPSAGIEPLLRPARAIEPGHFRVDALDVPLAGRWTVTLGILIGDFDKRHVAAALPIR
jgi:copper transport protein